MDQQSQFTSREEEATAALRDPAVLLPQVKAVMEVMPRQNRVLFHEFWRTVRNAINMAIVEIDGLRSSRGNPVSRPPTTASVQRLRAEMDRVMEQEASFITTSSDVETARGLPRDWLQQFLNGMRVDKNEHPLGCWFSGNRPSHKSYVKVNLRNTKHPLDDRRMIGIQMFVHQLAIIADGRGNQLGLTTVGQGSEVSHLCHNGACFNPGHLVVEPRELNQARNACQRRRVVRCADGTVLHPCSHWTWTGGSARECILPSTEIRPNMAGLWLRASPDGSFVVRETKK